LQYQQRLSTGIWIISQPGIDFFREQPECLGSPTDAVNDYVTQA
jgi:hypothetical protein